MIANRRYLVLTGVVITLLLCLTGCLETYTSFKIAEDGTADIQFILVADEVLAGDESDIVAFVLQNSFTELQTDYDYTRELRISNRVRYIYHIFRSRQPIDIRNHRYISFTKNNDGSYSFQLQIPPLVGKVDRTDQDTLMFKIIVSLPAEIETANSTSLRGSTVDWSVYKKDLVESLVLKARTRR